MPITIRRVAVSIAIGASLIAGFWLPASAFAKEAGQRFTMEYQARAHHRYRTYHVGVPDARFFGWGFGPSIEWYLANGYPGPYTYYWDCPIRPSVVVTPRGRQVVKLARVCRW